MTTRHPFYIVGKPLESKRETVFSPLAESGLHINWHVAQQDQSQPIVLIPSVKPKCKFGCGAQICLIFVGVIVLSAALTNEMSKNGRSCANKGQIGDGPSVR